jgi:hypothetical protein
MLQSRRRRIAQRCGQHRLPHVTIGTQLRAAAPAARRMRFHVMGVPGIELAVEEGVEQNSGFAAGHIGIPSSAIHAWRSMERARAKRDITVPMGAPTTSAIC